MTLRGRLLLYLVGLHVLLLAFSLALFLDRPPVFFVVELLLALSLYGGYRYIDRALEPLGYTRLFRELLHGQDYAARLRASSAPELNELLAAFNDMLAALHVERLHIGEQQGFLDRLLEATPSAVIVFDFDGNVSLMNASAQSLLGVGAARATLLALCESVPLGEARLLADDAGRRLRVQRGQFFDRGFARHFLIVEELTAELEQSERATYEKVIRVLAHEVNNTVAATGSVFDSLLYYSAQLKEEDRKDFGTAVEAVKRRNASLGEFIERFTRVVKMPVPERRPVAVNALVDDIIWLHREKCRASGIALEWERCDDVPEQMLDRQLMEQALVNIVKNAVEAAGRDGYVRIALTREDQGIRLSVTDSGNGLADVPPHQLFTPFFTTKKSGQGIGLLFVREVLLRHGLPHRLAPTGAGETRFDIWWPR